MRAGRYDFTLEQNATFHTLVTLRDSSDAHEPVVLDTFEAAMQIRDKPGGEIYVSLTSELNGGMTMQPSAQVGSIDIVISAADTLLVPWEGFGRNKMYYDIRINDKTNDDPAIRVLEGFITVSPAITVSA